MKPTTAAPGRLPLLRIGAVAKETGVSPSTLRWYESLGFVLPQRESSGYRLYSSDDVQWIIELRSFMTATGTGPRALARIMRWLPLSEIRTQILGTSCEIATPAAICWSGHTTPIHTRLCRACPAYNNKSYVLEFERHFTASLRPF